MPKYRVAYWKEEVSIVRHSVEVEDVSAIAARARVRSCLIDGQGELTEEELATEKEERSALVSSSMHSMVGLAQPDAVVEVA